jgi:hypothetical protein
MRGALWLILVSAVVGCGSSNQPAKKSTPKDGGGVTMIEAGPPKPVAVVMGMIKGMPFEPKGSGAQDSGSTMEGTFPSVKVQLYDVNMGACTLDAMATKTLSMEVFNAKDTNEIPPGTYTGMGKGVDTTGTIFPHFNWKDPMGEATGDDLGTVTLDEVSQTNIKGSFDVTLVTNGQDLGHITGTFDTPACN